MVNETAHKNAMMSRYKQHQSIARSRIGMKNGVTTNKGMDARNTHGAIPKQSAPSVNRTQTIQKDINTGTRGAHVPKQKNGLNPKTLQPDLHSARGGVHKPGAR